MDLFSKQPDIKAGEKNREDGMKQAEDHANEVKENWSQDAYLFLICHIPDGEFMTEDIRFVSQGHVPYPPSLRAWGSVIRRAAKEGRIRKVGTAKVKDANGHRGYATTWEKI